MTDRDLLYLRHILDALEKIEAYVSVGLRDILIHEDMGVDLDAIWPLTQREAPRLKRDIQAMRPNEDERGSLRDGE